MKALAAVFACALSTLSLPALANNPPPAVFDGFELPENVQADRVLVEKAKRQLTLFARGIALKTYKVALGKNPKGAKLYEGDNRTPEGIYTIDTRKEQSRFHRALHVSYPSADDVSRAQALGKSPGGNIMVHGLSDYYAIIGKYHVSRDWTEGCIAVTNQEIEEIWRVVPNGTVIEIRP